MPIFSRRGSGPRVFFATDIHGSETCFRKFLNSAAFYEADVIVLGGDMTGKALVPIVSNGDGRCHCYLQDQRHEFGGVDFAPAGLGGVDELVGHGNSGCA